jgi:2'-5' RNA ligase
VKEGREQLINVIEKLNRNLGYIRKEAHGPSLHLTIGRLRTGVNKEQLTQKISELNGVKIGETVVKEIVLKQSQLTKTGPIYTDLKAFCLEQSQQDSA